MMKRLTSSRLEEIQASCKPVEARSSFIPESSLEWKQIKASSNVIKKRSHHSASVIDGKMYIFGGYEVSRNGCGILDDLICYDLAQEKWEQIKVKTGDDKPGKLHSHTSISYKGSLVIFGGVFNTFQCSNKVFQFLPSNGQWKVLNPKLSTVSAPFLNSHASIVHGDRMIVFGGENSIGYNDKLLSFDLVSLEWKQLAVLDSAGEKAPCPRSQCSICTFEDRLYIFGGKREDQKLNDLWCFDLKSNLFTKIESQKQFTPMGRSGQACSVFQGNIVIFGGTTGITHERNDLIFYSIGENCWKRHWEDTQSSKNSDLENGRGEVLKKSVKKSRSNSVKKTAPNSSFSKGNKKATNCEKNSRIGKMTESRVDEGVKKYRRPMRDENYYNENYPFYGEKSNCSNSKFKKNDLLLDLERESHDEGRKSQLNPKGQAEQLKLSQTFESLSLSILNGFVAGQGLKPKAEQSEDKNLGHKTCVVPKARDGHTSCLFEDKMVIFGGDRHHMTYNDIVLIDLSQVFNPKAKSHKAQS